MTAGSTVTTYDYDTNNRLITETKVTGEISEITRYGYDHNGNQIYKATEVITPAEDGEVESIKISVVGEDEENSPAIMFNEYDGFNRLVKVLTGSTTAVYGYNGDGLRTSKTVNGISTKHIWDGSQIALELDNSGNVQSKYVRGINLIYGEIAGAKSYYLFNGHGDVVLLTNTNGDIVKNYDYDAFGNEKNPNPTDLNVFRYCGEYFDKETGTYYLRARYYDPSIGRFTTEDSYLGNNTDPLSLNLYTYCLNSPILYVDKSGHVPLVVYFEQFMYSSFGQQIQLYFDQYIGQPVNMYGQQASQYFETIGVDASYWIKNDAIPWVKNAYKDAGDAIKSGWDNLIQQLGGGYGSPDPNNFNKIPGRVQSRINISKDGWNHVLKEHFSGKNKSQFTISQDDLRSLLKNKNIIKTPITRALDSADGIRYVREIDLGYNIGIDKFSNFQPTTIMTILTDKYGNLITATPGVIK